MTVEAHLRQANHNADVASILSKGNTPISLQWAVTCHFYAGIHYVNAHLLHVRVDKLPRRHDKRERLVSKHMRPVYRAYKSLKKNSQEVRYDLFDPTVDYVENSRRMVQNIREFVSHKIEIS